MDSIIPWKTHNAIIVIIIWGLSHERLFPERDTYTGWLLKIFNFLWLEKNRKMENGFSHRDADVRIGHTKETLQCHWGTGSAL